MKLIVPPPIQGLIFAAAMWFASDVFSHLTMHVPFKIYAAGGLAIAGLAIEVVAIVAFIRAKTTVNPLRPDRANTLVVEGLYHISRNPMYLGLLLLLAAWGIWLGNLVNLPLVIGFVAYITVFQIKPEEAVLRDKFGDDYRAYCQRVRRWV